MASPRRSIIRAMPLLAAFFVVGDVYATDKGDSRAKNTPSAPIPVADQLPMGALARLGTTAYRKFDRTGFWCVAVSPKGAEVVAGCGVTVRRWDLVTGEELTFPTLGRVSIQAVAYFPNGGKILVSSAGGPKDAGIYLVDLVNGGIPHYFRVLAGGSPLPVATSSDGTLFAAGDSEGKVQVWDAKTEKLLQTIEGGTGGVRTIAFSPDGKVLAFGGGSLGRRGVNEDEPVCLAEVSSGKVLAKLDGHKYGVLALAFSPDGRRLYSAGAEHKVRCWDVDKRKELYVIETMCSNFALSPKGDLLATCYHGRPLTLWDADTGKRLREISGAGVDSEDVAFCPDGKRLVSFGAAAAVGVWDVETGKDLTPNSGHRQAVLGVAFSPSGTTLASRGGDQTVKLWRLPQGTLLRTHFLRTDLSCSLQAPFGVTYSPDGSLIAAMGLNGGQWDPKVRVWDAAKGELRADFEEYQEPERPGRVATAAIQSVAITADGKALATASRFGVRVRALSGGKELQLYDADGADGKWNPSYHLATASGPLLAIASGTKEFVRLWDYTTGRVVREFKMEKYSGNNLALSPDGRLLATGQHRDIVLWDVATGERLGIIRDPGASHPAYAFSPNGRLLASADGESREVKVWDVFTQKELATFKGHEAPATCVAFSPDGGLLASGSLDTTILLWDVRKLDATPPTTKPSAAELQKAWDGLTGSGAAGWRAANDLIGGGERTVAFLKDRLKPRPAADAERVRKLLADLDADNPKIREAATEELDGLADRAAPLLRAALEGKPSAEVRARVGRLLSGISLLPNGDEQIREDRGLYVLEQLDTKESREVLDRLAGGAATARLTLDAKAALDRLKRQEAARKAMAAAEK